MLLTTDNRDIRDINHERKRPFSNSSKFKKIANSLILDIFYWKKIAQIGNYFSLRLNKLKQVSVKKQLAAKKGNKKKGALIAPYYTNSFSWRKESSLAIPFSVQMPRSKVQTKLTNISRISYMAYSSCVRKMMEN